MDYEHHDKDHDNVGNNNDDYDLVVLQIYMENVIYKQWIDCTLFLTCYHHWGIIFLGMLWNLDFYTNIIKEQISKNTHGELFINRKLDFFVHLLLNLFLNLQVWSNKVICPGKLNIYIFNAL